MRNAITKEQVQEKQTANEKLTLIDIRSVEEYEKQHIPGITNIPAEDLAEKLSTFSKADTIVCVCNHGKERSQKAAEFLYDEGFQNAFYLEGGTGGWFI